MTDRSTAEPAYKGAHYLPASSISGPDAQACHKQNGDSCSASQYEGRTDRIDQLPVKWKTGHVSNPNSRLYPLGMNQFQGECQSGLLIISGSFDRICPACKATSPRLDIEIGLLHAHSGYDRHHGLYHARNSAFRLQPGKSHPAEPRLCRPEIRYRPAANARPEQNSPCAQSPDQALPGLQKHCTGDIGTATAVMRA